MGGRTGSNDNGISIFNILSRLSCHRVLQFQIFHLGNMAKQFIITGAIPRKHRAAADPLQKTSVLHGRQIFTNGNL